MKNYSVLEVSKILDITVRAVQKRCKRDKVTRKNNRYSITENQINEWKTERTERTNQPNKNELANELEKLVKENQELKKELEVYKIQEGERIEVFTNEEYEIFETRLRQWYSMQKDLQHQEQVFNAEKKSLSELVEHYKNQFDYQKKQSERILDMHQQLIDNIQKQNVIALQRQAIEAKEKNVR